jgi:hypothetical protein
MSIFIDNKYTKWYFNIITNARLQDRKKKQGIYYERHHIIPRGMDGSNESSNLILLTAKEHFLCHLLLTKMTNGQAYHKMIYALNSFIITNKHTAVNSKLYQRLKEEYSRINSINKMGENNHFYGKRHSEDTLQIIRENRKQQEIFGMVGKKHSAASKKLMSERAMGRTPPNKGKKGFQKGFKWYNNGIAQTRCLPENMPNGWSPGRLPDAVCPFFL